MQGEDVDPVLAEVDVFLARALSQKLHLLQYPLRPAHLPLEAGSVQCVRVRSEPSQMQVELAVSPCGENYSHSRGERYAKDTEMTPDSTTPVYRSGLMDYCTLTSNPQPDLSHRYVAGVIKDGELHLCPLQGVVQLRPSLTHLNTDQSAATQTVPDRDTTESEGEEAKPVTVRIASRDIGRNKRMSWSELSSKREDWVELEYFTLASQEACYERKLLFASNDSHIQSLSLPSNVFLDRLCPMQDKIEESVSPEPPGGSVSLSKLKGLPVNAQVHELLLSTGILTVGQLSSLLRCGRGQLPSYLEALQEHGVLVQGCWVAASHILYPADKHASLRDARDYLLCCFSQSRCIARKDVAALTKVPHEAVRQELASLTSGSGLEFKIPTDTDFIHKYPHIVRQQEEILRKRLEELKAALNLNKEQHRSPSGSAGDTRKLASKKLRPSAN